MYLVYLFYLLFVCVHFSEQDLKDFIKSSKRTMQKNGYMFIKQNFVSMDTEPSLTEISETGEPKVETQSSPNKPIIVSKMVQVQASNGKVVYRKGDQSAPALFLQSPQKKDTKAQNSVLTLENRASPNKSVNTSPKQHQGNILIVNKNIKPARNVSQINTKVAVASSSSKTIQYVQPVQLVPSSPTSKQFPLQVSSSTGSMPTTFLQVLPASGIPLMGDGTVQLIPVSMVSGLPSVMPVQNVSSIGGQTTLLACNTNDIKNIGQPIKLVTKSPVVQDNVGRPEQIQTANVNNTDKIAKDQIPVVSNIRNVVSFENVQNVQNANPTMKTEDITIDEKGAANFITEVQTPTQTPIVSDAPWQGVLNINSEQELLDFINSKSQSVIQSTGLEGDKSMTIYIQNVDPNIGTVTPLAVDVLQEPFSDQGTIMSDVLPVASNVEEVNINPPEGSMLIENGSLLQGDPTPSSIVSVEDGNQLSISDSVFIGDSNLSVSPGVEVESLKGEISVSNVETIEVYDNCGVNSESKPVIDDTESGIDQNIKSLDDTIFSSVTIQVKPEMNVMYTEAYTGHENGISKSQVDSDMAREDDYASKEKIHHVVSEKNTDHDFYSVQLSKIGNIPDESREEPGEEMSDSEYSDIDRTNPVYSEPVSRDVMIDNVDITGHEPVAESVQATDRITVADDSKDMQNDEDGEMEDEVENCLHVDLEPEGMEEEREALKIEAATSD